MTIMVMIERAARRPATRVGTAVEPITPRSAMFPNRAIAVLAAAAASALSPAVARGGPIQDNSFLVEEAYNQESGVIQHISAFNRVAGNGAWAYTFTEEWPVLSQTHQASVTFTYAGLPSRGGTGMGDLALNYRWQAVGDARPPSRWRRASRSSSSGDAARRLGSGGAGLQVNLPSAPRSATASSPTRTSAAPGSRPRGPPPAARARSRRWPSARASSGWRTRT
jgi:hypothetical protein